MCEISDLIFEANKQTFKRVVSDFVKEYKNNCKIEKIYENNELKGVFIHRELNGKIFLEEGHYTGNNKFVFLRAWRKVFDKNKQCFAKTTIFNNKMIKFLKNIGFKIYDQDKFNLYFQYGG